MKTTSQNIKDLIKTVRKELAGFSFKLYLYEYTSDRYQAISEDGNRIEGVNNFSTNSPLVAKLLQLNHDRVGEYIGDNFYIPLMAQNRLFGWLEIILSDISRDDFESMLKGLTPEIREDKLSIIQNMVNEDLSRKNQELNILSRIAQGINITIHFNDMLELIYAQTTQVIPADCFRIMLFNETENIYYYPFFLDDDERLSMVENKPIKDIETPEQKIIQTRKSILTNTFEQLGFSQATKMRTKELVSFIGVPLNSGADTIGCLSLGSNKKGIGYNNRQKDYLQAIADQTASAIMRSRLLEQTEKRAVQLAKLNEASKKLNSTLEVEPLLDTILVSAIELSGSDGGNLLLVDEDTDKLNIRKSIGVQKNSSAKMSVPIEANKRLIGVFEFFNETTSLSLQEDDKQMLSAFASQAATAIENARLYTLTDQNLTRKIEELSIMQQIDLELNANIDLDHALSITLEWALRYTGYQSGMIGLWDGEKVTNWQTKNPDIIFEDQLLNLHQWVQDLARNGTYFSHTKNQMIKHWYLNQKANEQVTVLIKRDSGLLGLMVLEGSGIGKDGGEINSFLTRLSDHATIAITNGLLFHQISEANLAKSEFVSFVAHELKNPMTSIKGYSELMAAGAVGPLTEGQSGFLQTIRTNVERMRTIVEDLNDITKIEAGRLRLEIHQILLNEVIDAVVNSTKKQVSEKKQTIEVVTSVKAPIYLLADKTRTEQILINLVSNANKYTPEGGSIILSIDPDFTNKIAKISVRDNGIGISEEDRPKIFTKFFRSEDDRARKSTGAGLGLNITKNLVEMQGGSITFESVYDQGTVFSLTLPLAENIA